MTEVGSLPDGDRIVQSASVDGTVQSASVDRTMQSARVDKGLMNWADISSQTLWDMVWPF